MSSEDVPVMLWRAVVSEDVPVMLCRAVVPEDVPVMLCRAVESQESRRCQRMGTVKQLSHDGRVRNKIWQTMESHVKIVTVLIIHVAIYQQIYETACNSSRSREKNIYSNVDISLKTRYGMHWKHINSNCALRSNITSEIRSGIHWRHRKDNNGANRNLASKIRNARQWKHRKG